MQNLINTTPSTTTIVSVAEIKTHLGITTTAFDSKLTQLLEDATELVEREAATKFTVQVWTQTQKCWSSSITLMVQPAASVVVKYYDLDNVLQTLSSTNYHFFEFPSDSILFNLTDYPDLYDRPDAVQITISVGAAPRLARQCVKLLVADWFYSPESTVVGTIATPMPNGYDKIMRLLRRGHVA
jgi:uncharacterized phiE125 gp8 family phage protein